ncbi:MAG: hypothetical protein AAF467_24325 [Actinomycetota bacterium]
MSDELVEGQATASSTAAAIPTSSVPEQAVEPTTVPVGQVWSDLPVCGATLIGAEVDGELSDVGWVAAGQIDRASVGLSSDAASVLEVAEALPDEHLVANGVRTEAERIEVFDAFGYAREPFFDQEVMSIRWDHSDISGGVVPAGLGRFAVTHTADGEALANERIAAAERRADAAGISVDLLAVEVERSADDLDAIHRRLEGLVPEWWLAVEPRFNAVAVDLGFAEASDSTRWPLTEHLDGVCRRVGDQPGDFGPQPAQGEGWRLLAITDSSISEAPTVATSVDELAELWSALEVPDDLPSLDSSTEIVATFYQVRGFAPSCDRVFFDGVVFEAGAVSGQPRTVEPEGLEGCLAVGLPRTFVVALDRRYLPDAPFTLRRSTEPWSYDVAREEVEVDLDNP